jgi:opacity protein-like surface antigen
MKTLRKMLVAMLAATALLSASAFAADANIAGEWDMAVETQAGSGTPHFSFKQEGSTLTGTYKGQLGEAPVTGTVKGNEATWSFKVNAQGVDLTITYTGTVEGDTMKGKLTLGDMGEGTFTGKKAG